MGWDSKKRETRAHVLNAELAHGESCFVDTSRLGTRAQHVRLDGDVARVCYSLYLVKETAAVSGSARVEGGGGRRQRTRELNP